MRVMTKSNSQSRSHNPESPNPGSQDGVLVIDKPEGLTSHDVVARVRKILKTRRVGHTGTLDPFATGVLVVCVYRSTRLVQFLAGAEKEYFATMRLGFATDTGDYTGNPKSSVTDTRNITSEKVQEVFCRFQGHIKQIPPMYSAKKVGGVKLYEMARRGEEIERAPIVVEIKKLELFKPAGDSSGAIAQASAQTAPGEFTFQVVCSSGTYIRALAEEIGRHLGVGAHLTRLRRTRVGNCSLGKAATLAGLSRMAESGRSDQVMVTMADAISMPALRVDCDDRKRVSHGRSIEHPEAGNAVCASGALAKVYDKKNQLIAIAQYDAGKTLWRPRVVLID